MTSATPSITLVVPIGLALLNSTLSDGVSLNFWSNSGKPLFWKALIGLLIAINPTGIYAGAVVKCWLMKKIRPRAEGSKKDEPCTSAAVLAQKYATDTETQTVESPNPTSVEFEATFAGLMGEALAESARRVVIA